MVAIKLRLKNGFLKDGERMKLSTKSQYGLKACYVLAKNPQKSFSATALEKEICVSKKYLEKIMRMLSSRKIIAADRGASG